MTVFWNQGVSTLGNKNIQHILMIPNARRLEVLKVPVNISITELLLTKHSQLRTQPYQSSDRRNTDKQTVSAGYDHKLLTLSAAVRALASSHPPPATLTTICAAK